MSDKTKFSPDENAKENIAQTTRDIMASLAKPENLPSPDGMDLTSSHLVTVPRGLEVKNLTPEFLSAQEYMKPNRRRGTANLADLKSLIAWANRFKSDNSAIFLNPDPKNPKMTCIADYHAEGPDVLDPQNGSEHARHCAHKAIYPFPISKDWEAWQDISGKGLGKDEMGAFIEDQSLAVMDPTPAMIKLDTDQAHEPWETRLIEMANKLGGGRFGQLHELLAMSKSFAIHETSALSVTTDRSTGEAHIGFVDEHKSPTGEKLNIPKLIMIAIPVFQNGAPYRLAVRLSYRKNGADLKFFLTIHNPEKVFDAAIDEAAQQAVKETDLPLFMGSPEQ